LRQSRRIATTRAADATGRANAEGIGRKHGEIRPVQVESALFRIEEGKTSLIEMEHGFRIVKVVNRRNAGKRPFDYQAQKRIYEKLRSKVFERDTKRIIAKLKQMMVIEIESEPKPCEGTASEGADDRPGPVGVLRPGAGDAVEMRGEKRSFAERRRFLFTVSRSFRIESVKR
jgi:hypothetical protein